MHLLYKAQVKSPRNIGRCCFSQENTPDAERTLMIRENIYVRVHGHVRAFAGKRSIVAFRVAPIADMNELTTHMLEVIYAHAYLVRGGTPMVSVFDCRLSSL